MPGHMAQAGRRMHIARLFLVALSA